MTLQQILHPRGLATGRGTCCDHREGVTESYLFCGRATQPLMSSQRIWSGHGFVTELAVIHVDFALS